MNDSSTRHTVTLVVTALGLLMLASALPWSRLTDNRLKDFNLLSDILPRADDALGAAVSLAVDPELEALIGIDSDLPAAETPHGGGAELPGAAADSIVSDSIPSDNVAVDSTVASLRPWVAPLTCAPVDAEGHVLIENYTGGAMLPRLKAALQNVASGIVRIAVVGDSYIEGDIFVQDLRAILQEEFGGSGVGYMNLHSDFPGFRRSVRQGGSGWKCTNVLGMSRRDSVRTLSREYARVEGVTARATYRGSSQSATTGSWQRSALRLLASDSATVTMDIDGQSREFAIAPTAKPVDVVLDGATTSLTVSCSSPAVTALGVFLDGAAGIAVDCMSVRGTSGLTLARTNADMSLADSYALIILEFGVNALSAEQTQYTAYGHGITRTIRHLEACYPKADILVMGIADRGAKIGSSVNSLPTCNAMTDAQRKAASDAGVHFYDLRAAQGGENSIVEWRRRSLVNADYIHLNHAGGKVLAEEFASALKKALSE